MKKLQKILIILCGVVLIYSCEKILTVDPQGDAVFVGEEAIQDEEDLQMLLNSIYDVEANFLSGQDQNLSELLADNLAQPNSQDDYTQVWKRGSNFFNGTVENVYADAYIAIYRGNVVLKDMSLVDLSDESKQRFEAEVRFIRALNHFWMVRQFAQPFGYSTNNTHNGVVVKTTPTFEPVSRATVASVYNQIVADLKFAEANLPVDNGIYADQYCAKALLAKVYLEMLDFENAYLYANDVITSGRYTLDDLDRFSPGRTTETIFELVSTPPNDERGTGFKDNYRSDGENASPTLTASFELYNLATSDTNDLRGQSWYRIINEGSEEETYGVAKFDYSNINVPVLHLTEMYLIRAEANGELNQNLSQGEDDLNLLRTRAGIDEINVISGSQLVLAAHQERRLEMVFEGDRVHQLKRMALMGYVNEIRGVPWDCNGMIIQFPNSEGTVTIFEFNPEGGCNE